MLVCYILCIPAPFQVEKKLMGAQRDSYDEILEEL